MMEKIFRKPDKKCAEKYLKYFSAPFLEIYYLKQNNILKNYVLDPDIKLIK